MIKSVERSYRGVSASQRRSERRERLLDAGLELFATVGYNQTSIEQICAMARVTARHFYEAFPGREALLCALYDQIIVTLQDAIAAAVAAEGEPGVRIRLAVGALVKHYLQDWRKARVGVLEVVGVSVAMEVHRRQVIHDMAAILERFLDRLAGSGTIPKGDYHVLAVAMVGGINEVMAEWLTGQHESVSQLSEEVVRILEATIQGLALPQNHWTTLKTESLG